MTQDNKTYVFNSVEVKTTGRTAKKDVEKVDRLKRRSEGTETVTQVLHEITPTDSFDGKWKKWVDLSELHTIEVATEVKA